MPKHRSGLSSWGTAVWNSLSAVSRRPGARRCVWWGTGRKFCMFVSTFYYRGHRDHIIRDMYFWFTPLMALGILMPKEIEFRAELPKTLVGKVAYRKLEEEEEERQAADA